MAEKWWEGDPIAKAPQGDQWWANDPIAGQEKERTVGEALSDIYAGGKIGIGRVLEFPSQLASVVTGEYEKPGEETGLAAAGKEMQREGEAMKSPGMKAREAARAGKIAEAEKRGQVDAFFTAFSETVKDPALLTNFLVEQAPQLLPSFGAARLATTAAGVRAGVGAAVGTGATQQGADVAAGTYEQAYNELIKKGVPEEKAAGQAIGLARASGAGATVISLLAQRLPGARAIEEALAGAPGSLGRILGGARGALGETVSEVAEETPAKALQNLLMQQGLPIAGIGAPAPETSLTAGLGEVAAMAALGGAGLGGVSGLLQRQQRPEAPPEEPKQPPSAFAPGEEPTPEPPVTPPTEPSRPGAMTPEGAEAAMENYFAGDPAQYGEALTAIQNRARNTEASVRQMEGIAAAPKYENLGSSEDLGDGAPVVISDFELDPSRLGTTDIVRGADGSEVPVRYAVVEAAELTPSIMSDGSKVDSYADPSIETIRPLVGNRRVAGLQAAYQAGTTEEYKQGLIDDSDHGINPDVIAGMAEPVLVRLMPKEVVTPDIDYRASSGGQLAQNYGTDAMMDLYEDATDEGMGRILGGMEIAGTAMRGLEGAGEYDVRPIIAKAAELAANAKQQGVSLEDYVKQGDVEMDPLTQKVVEMFARNEGNEKQVGDYLNLLAQEAGTAFEESQGQLIGRPLEEVFKVLEQEPRPIPGVETPEKPEFKIDKNPEQIAQEIQGMGVTQISQWLIDNAPNSAAKAIAEAVHTRLVDFEKRRVRMPVKILDGRRRDPGAYGSVTISTDARGIQFEVKFNGVDVNGNADDITGTDYETIMHELLHVATRVQLGFLSKSNPIIKQFTNLKNTIDDQIKKDIASGVDDPFINMMRDIKRQYEMSGRPRAWEKFGPMRMIDEVLTWGLTDPDYQKYLAKIELTPKVSAFTKFAELLRRMLGLSPQYQTALEQVAALTEEILAKPTSEVARIAKQAGTYLGVRAKPRKRKTTSEKLETEIFKKFEEKARQAAKKAAGQREPGAAFKHIGEDLQGLIRKNFYAEQKTIVDRIDGMKDDFWKKLAQGVADQYRSIKDYTQEGYMLARLSKSIDGALSGLLFSGEVGLTDGALDIKKGTKGLMEAMKPVGKEVDSYLIWVAANRDAQLRAAGKQGSLDPRIVERRNEFAQGMLNGKPRIEVYKQVQKDMSALNKSVLDIALKQGIIDRTAYKRFSEDIWYVPFYREMEGGDIQGASTAAGLSGQYFSKELKGGEKPIGDLLENTLMNWSHILSAAMKNKAANVTMDAAMNLDKQFAEPAAYPILKANLEWRDGKVYSKLSGKMVGDGSLRPEFTTRGKAKNVVKLMRDGKPIYFEVVDPLLLESVMSIGYLGMKSKFLDVAKDFKNLLQYGVTLSPGFKVRNLIRDSWQAAAVSDLDLNLPGNVLTGLRATDEKNPDYISALAGGAVFNFGTAYEGDQAKMVKRLIKQGIDPDTILTTEEKIKKGLALAWKKYQDWGNKSEAANRMALYKQLKEKGMSHLEASFYARDLLDFSMQGAWPAFRLVTQVVPFLNARVQGLYKLGRDGIIPTSRVIYNGLTGKEITGTDKQRAQQFSVVAGATVLASMMLYMAFKDDDEFKKREQWDRDNFWWIKLPGMDSALRVPKPFEIGAFGTLAERLTEQMIDKGAEGRVFEQSLKRMLTDTFAINPMPQVFKPLVDLYANKDSFTGAPIETAGMERLSKAERIATNTSPLAIALSKVANVFLPESMEASPVQADYAIKAYLGWMGATIAGTSHYAMMPFSKGAYPDQNWTETMSMGFIKTLPAAQSGYVTSFYENMKLISQAYADMRHYAEIGESDKVQKLIEEKGDEIAMAKFYDKTSKDMAKIRQAINVIQADTTMTGSQKRQEIDRMKILIGELAKQAEDARKSLRK